LARAIIFEERILRRAEPALPRVGGNPGQRYDSYERSAS
jgi:hypothetical protein